MICSTKTAEPPENSGGSAVFVVFSRDADGTSPMGGLHGKLSG